MSENVLKVLALSIFILLVLTAAYFLKVNNVGVWSAVNVESLVYSKDTRTNVCYAQTSEGITYVPCENVEHLID